MRIIILLYAVLVSGCASLINESTQHVTVGTLVPPPSETSCNLSNEEGQWSVLANHSVAIKRDGNPMRVTCENDGQKGMITVNPVFRTGFLMMDILLLDGCLISCIIDGYNNAFYEYESDIIVPMRYKNQI